MAWHWILIAVGLAVVLLILSILFYRQFFKRFYDVLFSAIALILLSPVIFVLTLIGAIAMHGNPFFVQKRPGKIDKKTGKEKIFNLIKFRTMTNQKDSQGNLLPDEVRLNKYGEFLRSTSLDELPELLMIFIGHMSIVGPRPLLVEYLERYSEEQRNRHNVRPGLTGYAQVNGRNAVTWEERFSMDVWYSENVSFFGDIGIVLKTVKTVLLREGINSETSVTMEEFLGTVVSEEASGEAHV